MTIFLVSFLSVAKLVLVVLLGVVLGKRGVITKEGRACLSNIIMMVMLPCLLVASLSQNASVENLGKLPMLMVAAAVYVAFGLLVAALLRRVFRIGPENARIIGAATSFGNASYLPLPLLAAACASAPVFADDPSGALSRSVAYVSIFLMCHSPLLWLVAFPYLSGHSWRELRLRQVLNMPILASTTGVILGTVPFLRALIVDADAPLRIVIDSCELVSQGVFPCALLVLGATLAQRLPAGESVPLRVFSVVALGKLVLMPVLGFFFTMALWRGGLIPDDPVCVLVLMLEAAVPPANNLIIMCQMHQRGEAVMARVLLVMYCLAVPSLTIAMMCFLKVIS